MKTIKQIIEERDNPVSYRYAKMMALQFGKYIAKKERAAKKKQRITKLLVENTFNDFIADK